MDLVQTTALVAGVAWASGLNLYAAVRPVRSLPGIHTRYQDVDMVVRRVESFCLGRDAT